MIRLTQTIHALLLVLLVVTVGAQQPTVGDKIVAFCRDHMGKMVGNGECAVLVDEALRAVNCPVRAGPDSPSPGDYVWGNLILLVEAAPHGPKYESGSPRDIRPGDIVQFRDAKFERRSPKRYWFFVFEHHTAIIKSTDNNGATIHILEQNVSGKKIVMEGTLNLPELTKGWLRFYRAGPS